MPSPGGRYRSHYYLLIVPPVLSLFVAGDISIRALSEKLMEHEAEARGSSRVDIVVGGRTLRSQR